MTEAKLTKEEENKEIARLYGNIMSMLGIEWNAENIQTPDRVARALSEMTSNLNKPTKELEKELTMFASPGSHVEVELEGIDFTSLCAHHHLPFSGKAFIKYNPGDKIFGLSKFPRVIEWFSRKPQTQEHMTTEIGEFLVKFLEPAKLTVELRNATHSCMTSRGVKAHNSNTTTRFVYEHKPDSYSRSGNGWNYNEPTKNPLP